MPKMALVISILPVILQKLMRNPQVAACRSAINAFSLYNEERQAMMKGALVRIKGTTGLSNDLGEVINKALLVKI